MNCYYYEIYETIIESEIKILNLPVIFMKKEAKARIIKASVASEYIPVQEFGTYYSPNVCAMGCSWGTMEVSNGNLIRIFLYDSHEEEEAGPFIIGWGLSFLFHQLGYTCFHCSALCFNNKGLMVSGISGAGKSSTALSLLDMGAKYLADDMAILRPDQNFELIPSYPIQKVCRDVSIHLEEECLLHINEGRDKFSYYNEAQYYDKHLKASHLVLLKKHEGEDLLVKEYLGVDKWYRIMECMYLSELYASFGISDKDKFACLKLAESLRVLEISRPEGKDTIQEITKVINEFTNS